MPKKITIEFSDKINVNAQWLSFSRAIFAQVDPSVNQYMQAKLAFYAGVFSMLGMNLQVGDLSETQAMSALDQLLQECESFFVAHGGGTAIIKEGDADEDDPLK